MKRLLLSIIPIIVVLAVGPLTTRVAGDPIPQGWKAHSMQPVGYSDMEGRPPFKLAIKRVGEKWDLKLLPGMPNSWNIQVTLHDNLIIGALQPKVAAWGGDPTKPGSEGIIIWDISDPLNPKEVSRWKSGSGGTHRNSYPGGRYAYLCPAIPAIRAATSSSFST